jgi:hypothetical protein
VGGRLASVVEGHREASFDNIGRTDMTFNYPRCVARVTTVA